MEFIVTKFVRADSPEEALEKSRGDVAISQVHEVVSTGSRPRLWDLDDGKLVEVR